MRVCMLGYTFYETDSRVRQYAKALRERGDEVDFIGLGTKGQLAEEVVEGVRTFRIQRRQFDEKGKISYLFKLLRFLASSSLLLSRKHLRNRYDLIHIHSVPDFLVFAAWLARLTGAKIVLDIHDVVPEFYASKFKVPPGSLSFGSLLLVERLCTAFADHVIVANDVWREKLICRSLKPSKCTTILNYPMHIVPQGHARHEARSKFIILYPGSLNHHQGVDIAVRAFALVKNLIPESEFHIYGQGSEFENILRQIQQLGLEKRVFLRPQVSHEDILRIMERADLGVDPKRTDGFANEALGGKIFEFMALGVPTVISDTLTNKHYFNDSVVRFYRGGDAEDLAHSILALHRDQEATRRLVQTASEFVRDYEWDVRISIYLDLVDSLVLSARKMQTRKLGSLF
jgi:glycosyltransferase involved in cell wall biosynthesis